MIKRIIFDVDDTLIGTDSLSWEKVSQAFTKYGIEVSDTLRDNFTAAYKAYEKSVTKFTPDGMLKYISSELNMKLPDDFIDSWKEVLSTCVFDDNVELKDTIKYLASKYELYVATNWYIDQQMKRLENSGVLEYFKEGVGCDMYNMKPDIEMYNYLKGDCLPEEVAVVGDNFTNDIMPALELGMKAYYINKEDIDTKEYKVIKNLNELKNIL